MTANPVSFRDIFAIPSSTRHGDVEIGHDMSSCAANRRLTYPASIPFSIIFLPLLDTETRTSQSRQVLHKYLFPLASPALDFDHLVALHPVPPTFRLHLPTISDRLGTRASPFDQPLHSTTSSESICNRRFNPTSPAQPEIALLQSHVPPTCHPRST